MAVLRVQCPYCERTERMTFHGPFRQWDSQGQITTLQNHVAKVAGAALCPGCQTPVGLEIQGASGSLSSLLGAATAEATDAAMGKHTKIRTIPRGTPIVLDDALPEAIRQPFADIQEDAKRRRHATGILSVARGCLDVALKDRGEGKGTRRERIARLAERKIITEAIAAWSQTLWEEGSDAAHDLQADIDRAIEHVEFLKLFFEVVYRLPARIAQVSHTAEPKTDEACPITQESAA